MLHGFIFVGCCISRLIHTVFVTVVVFVYDFVVTNGGLRRPCFGSSSRWITRTAWNGPTTSSLYTRRRIQHKTRSSRDLLNVVVWTTSISANLTTIAKNQNLLVVTRVLNATSDSIDDAIDSYISVINFNTPLIHPTKAAIKNRREHYQEKRRNTVGELPDL